MVVVGTQRAKKDQATLHQPPTSSSCCGPPRLRWAVCPRAWSSTWRRPRRRTSKWPRRARTMLAAPPEIRTLTASQPLHGRRFRPQGWKPTHVSSSSSRREEGRWTQDEQVGGAFRPTQECDQRSMSLHTEYLYNTPRARKCRRRGNTSFYVFWC